MTRRDHFDGRTADPTAGMRVLRPMDLRPGMTVLSGGTFQEVIDVTHHAPGTHPHSPIKDDRHAVQVHTMNGSRWFGDGGPMVNAYHPDFRP